MMPTKNVYGRMEQKIADYETVANFYERNRELRFQTKSGLKKIADEIDLELDRGQTADNLERLKILKTKFSVFV